MKKKILVQETNCIERKTPGMFGVFLSMLFGFLLTFFTTLLVLLMFVYALNENVRIPSIGPISGDHLEMFLDSWSWLVLGGALVVIPVISLILINVHCIRRFFASVGISSIITALFCIILGFTGTYVIKMFSGEWQNTLVNATVVFRDFSLVCAMILIAIGVTCMSIYSCIVIVKGAKHEKNT